jgi:hypothetical protein
VWGLWYVRHLEACHPWPCWSGPVLRLGGEWTCEISLSEIILPEKDSPGVREGGLD